VPWRGPCCSLNVHAVHAAELRQRDRLQAAFALRSCVTCSAASTLLMYFGVMGPVDAAGNANELALGGGHGGGVDVTFKLLGWDGSSLEQGAGRFQF
jgi:hypothetical protein